MRLTAYFIIPFLLCLGIWGNVNAQYNFNVKQTFGETNHQIVFASYNSDGSYIITAGSDSSIIIWNADRRTIYRTLSGLKGRPNVAVFSADNKFVLSGGKDNKVSIWDIGPMPPRIIKTFEGYPGQIKSLDVSRDGKYLATGSSNGTIRIWDLLSTNLVYDLKGHNKNKDVNAIAFSPDSKNLASGGDDGTIILWNIENGIMIESQPAQKNGIQHITFSPDGNFLASCGYDNLIYIYQLPGLKNKLILKGHKDWIQTIDFSPDSKSLISGGRDELIILWDVATGAILHKSERQGAVVLSLSFSPVRPDFISAYYKSENLDVWGLSGFNETQWKNPAGIIAETKVQSNIISDNEQRVTQEKVVNQISQTKESPGDNSMIELFSPPPVQGKIVHDKNSIILIGRVSDPEGINAFLINKIPVKLSDAGVFQTTISLVKGENPMDLIAINNKMKMSEMKLTVTCISDAVFVQESQTPDIYKGKYYALLMAVNDYQSDEIADLDNPIKDAETLCNVLLSKYTFEKENIRFLRNPVLKDIISALDDLGKTLTQNDNLLIFYAGHGYWDDKGKVGYWFPSDAARNSTVNWFRNSTLRDFIGSIQTRHTILIADACFSGAIFKTRAAFAEAPQGVQKLYELPSRKAMTSGILQVVPDESMFMKYMVERLAENNEKFLPSELLFSSFKNAVMNNSSNVPQYGVIQNVGDEGGDFIFIKR
jgi:WD40 repeat protein